MPSHTPIEKRKKTFRGRMVGDERKKSLAREQQRLDVKVIASIPGILKRHPELKNKLLSDLSKNQSGKGVGITFKKRKKKK